MAFCLRTLQVSCMLVAVAGRSPDTKFHVAAACDEGFGEGDTCLLQREGEKRHVAARSKPGAAPGDSLRTKSEALEGKALTQTADLPIDISKHESVDKNSSTLKAAKAAAPVDDKPRNSEADLMASPIAPALVEAMAEESEARQAHVSEEASVITAKESMRLVEKTSDSVMGPGVLKSKSKLTLLIIEMFPILWPLGIDRFYLGDVRLGIAKLAVCFLTCGVGGIVWGVVDFIAIVNNALQGTDSINVLGLQATFQPSAAKTGQILAIVDIVMVFVWFGGAWAIHSYRNKLKIQRLQQNALKPNLGKPPSVAGGAAGKLLTQGS